MIDFSNPTGIQSMLQKVRVFLRPPPKLSPSEWAEQNMSIPIGNALSGKMRFSNAPYQREPLDILADPKCYRVTLMWAAQTGKTQLLNAALGYFISHEPQSQMMMQPSEGDLRTWLETKFNPMVDGNETLRSRIAAPRSREGVNNQQMKSYPGGFLMFSWAGSPRTMRGRSAPKIYCDEVDGYEYTAEGHPVNLLWQRAATFGDQRKLLVTSTPTIKNKSFVETSFLDGDQRYYFMPCVHCGEMIRLKWSNVVWDKDGDKHLPHTAVYTCDECGGIITDTDKIVMLRNGKWIGTKPFTGHASYHLNELYSAFRKFSDIVISFLEKKANNDMQSFTNVSLAETFGEDADQANPDALINKAENFDQNTELGVNFLTFGADIQKDRIEMTVFGWKSGFECFVITHKVFWGDTLAAEVWNEFDKATLNTYCGKKIAGGLVDAGFRTDTVDGWTRKRHGRRIYSSIGSDSAKQIVSNPRQTGGLRAMRVDVGVSIIKTKLLHILKNVGEHIHFSYTLDKEYYDQLTAEKAVVKLIKGFKKIEWHKTRERNEAIDTFCYGYASAVMLNPNWEALSKVKVTNVEPVKEPEPEPEPTVTELLKKPPRVRQNFRPKRNFVRNY